MKENRSSDLMSQLKTEEDTLPNPLSGNRSSFRNRCYTEVGRKTLNGGWYGKVFRDRS